MTDDAKVDDVRVRVLKREGEAQPGLLDVVQTRAIQQLEEDRTFFMSTNALEPPYDPRVLVMWWELSNALRQNVDAYATNIDGFGHAFKAVIDLEADSTVDNVRTLIALERQSEETSGEKVEPTDEEVATRILDLARDQRLESLTLAAFFADCTETSFTDLRRRTRTDMEITGNGYWEVLRDKGGKISQFNYVESITMRLCELDTDLTEYSRKRRTLTQDFETVKRYKRFRRFIQRVGTKAVYFKEFGDPRVISSQSGKVYTDVDTMRKAEPNVLPAAEMMHFPIPSPRTPYGIPRWIGNTLSVLGSRQSEEVNHSYFENKSVPPLAVLVSGGRLTKDSVEKLESFIDKEIRGKENYHKILIIEAEGAEATPFENSGRMRVELKPLTEAQASDALFQNYDERNIDKVGMSFRVPRMLRGDTRDFNRSTAMAALDFAERQVFEPERTSFDDRINRDILPELGIKHWQLKSNGPTQRDPESLAKMIHDLQDFLTPNILMELAQGVFNRNFPRIEAEWADQPMKLTLATVNSNVEAGTPEAEDTNPDNQAPGNEPESSTLETADNKTKPPGEGQGRDPNGQFGSGGRKKPPKKRPAPTATPARKQAEQDGWASVATSLVEARDRFRTEVIRETVKRIALSREADNDNAEDLAHDA